MKLLDAVLEFNPFDDFRHSISTVELSPFCLCRHHQLERHGQTSFSAQAALGLAGAVADGSERALNGVGRPDVFPVLGGEVVEGQKHIAVFGQFSPPPCHI